MDSLPPWLIKVGALVLGLVVALLVGLLLAPAYRRLTDRTRMEK